MRYSYDLFGRRIAQELNGTKTLHIYNGDHVWTDLDAAGDVLARFLFGDKIDEVIARVRLGEGTSWYLTDKLGTVRDIVDANGDVADHIDYGAFGDVILESNPEFGDRYKFTGREIDSVTGLYYFRARYYDSFASRFTSPNPLQFKTGETSLYRYIANSPSNGLDPTGTQGLIAEALAELRALTHAYFARLQAAAAAQAAGLTANAAMYQAQANAYQREILIVQWVLALAGYPSGRN